MATDPMDKITTEEIPIAAEMLELYARYIQGLKRISEKERDEIVRLLDEFETKGEKRKS